MSDSATASSAASGTPPTDATALPSTPDLTQDDSKIDKVFLALSVATLVLAAVLESRGPKDVVVPLVNWTLPESCSLRAWTGIDCAGCGMTRSFVRLAHGDFQGAWAVQPIGPLLFALIAAQIPYRGWQVWRCRTGRGRWPGTPWLHVPLMVIVVLMLARWVVRFVSTMM